MALSRGVINAYRYFYAGTYRIEILSIPGTSKGRGTVPSRFSSCMGQNLRSASLETFHHCCYYCRHSAARRVDCTRPGDQVRDLQPPYLALAEEYGRAVYG